MISRLDLRGTALSDLDNRRLREVLPRADFDVADALEVVLPICHAVRDRGAAAVREFGERFDGVVPDRLRVPAEVSAAALESLDPQVRAALEESIRRARLVHADQMPAEHVTDVAPGGRVGQRWIPVERVGLYVPGGLAVYPSSVVMNVVPAQEAGVRSLAVASPPQRDNTGVFTGYPHPTVLAACELLGVDEVYAVGGAQAVAMFAYGAREPGVGADGATLDNAGEVVCEPVDLVTGPGNVYVASAKRALRGVIGIDAEAGPTEIAILADATADPAFVAADLISQAEHDPLAASVLVTDSEQLVVAVEEQLAVQVAQAPHRERIEQALTGSQSGVVLVDDVTQGLAVVNAYGAEHLEIHTEDSPAAAARVTNAGAVFVGPYAPVSLGDYAAGSNHVLPTGGSSRYDGGLSVQTFLRGIHVVQYDREALAGARRAATVLAEAEGLPSHGRAIDIRFDQDA